MPDNGLIDSLKKSFEYWSAIDEESKIECLLVWKKILNENSNFLKNQTILINNNKLDAQNQIEQFLESWSKAIEEPMFETAITSIREWKDFLENTNKENQKVFTKVLELLETSWETRQRKNIE